MVGFSGSLLALALGSGFCETENTLDRKDRVANRSRHHVDQRTRDGKEDEKERMKETKMIVVVDRWESRCRPL